MIPNGYLEGRNADLPRRWAHLDTTPMAAGMARCAVTGRVQRAERILRDVRITAQVAPLNAAPDGAARHPYPDNRDRRILE
jgi:hypothetical protein